MNGDLTLVATNAGTGGTTMVCSACNFTANGITTADVVRVFCGDGTGHSRSVRNLFRDLDHSDANDEHRWIDKERRF